MTLVYDWEYVQSRLSLVKQRLELLISMIHRSWSLIIACECVHVDETWKWYLIVHETISVELPDSCQLIYVHACSVATSVRLWTMIHCSLVSTVCYRMILIGRRAFCALCHPLLAAFVIIENIIDNEFDTIRSIDINVIFLLLLSEITTI